MKVAIKTKADHLVIHRNQILKIQRVHRNKMK